MTTVLLFVPGDRPERFPKAAAAGPDRVIIDLEDAVAPGNKVAARAAAVAALGAGLQAIVRINPPHEREGAADLAALGAYPPLALLVPKVGDPTDIALARAALPGVPLYALIESIAGIRALERIATAPGLIGLAFGAYDLCAELGARVTPEVIAPWRAQVVLAARAAGIAAIDTPYVNIEDEAGLAADAHRAVDFGFDGVDEGLVDVSDVVDDGVGDPV